VRGDAAELVKNTPGRVPGTDLMAPALEEQPAAFVLAAVLIRGIDEDVGVDDEQAQRPSMAR
jgi:hypothetical protein